VNIEILLEQVRKKSKPYEEEELESGDKYNIFNILDIKDKELFHSRFLYTLLDPKGVHGKDIKFLKKFIEIVLPPEISATVDYKSTKVLREHDIGDYGRLDIFIQWCGFNLIIENKIYFQDSPGQIQKYDRFLNEKYSIDKNKNYIVYLTLDGSDPVNSGKYKIENELIPISYEKEIIKWLEYCEKDSINLPLFNKNISQYINIVKMLTDQTRSKEMEQELKKLLINNGNVKYARTIYKVFPKAMNELIYENIVEPLKYKGLVPDKHQKYDVKQQYYGYSFSKKEWCWDNIKFRFEFSGFALSFSGFRYGIWGQNPELFKYLKEKGEDVQPPPNNNMLIKQIKIEGEDYIDWIKGEVFPKIISRENEVLKEMEKLISLIDDIARIKNKDSLI